LYLTRKHRSNTGIKSSALEFPRRIRNLTDSVVGWLPLGSQRLDLCLGRMPEPDEKPCAHDRHVTHRARHGSKNRYDKHDQPIDIDQIKQCAPRRSCAEHESGRSLFRGKAGFAALPGVKRTQSLHFWEAVLHKLK